MIKKNKVIFDTSILTIGQYVAQIFIILRSFISANLLGPYYFGLWSKVLYFLDYAQFLTLGMDININRKINVRYDKNEALFLCKVFINYLKNFIISSHILAFFLILIIRIKATYDKKDLYSFIVILYYISSTLIITLNFIRQLLLSKALFFYSALIRILGAFSSLVAVIVFVRLYGMYGMFFSYVLLQLVPIIVILIIFRKKIIEIISYLKNNSTFNELKKNFSKKTFLVNSISIITLFFCVTFWSQMDKFFISIFFSNIEVGYYFFSSNVINGLGLIIISFSMVIYKKLCSFGDDKTYKFKYFLKVSHKIFLIYPILLSIAYIWFPIIIDTFFKKYIGSKIIFSYLLFSILYINLVSFLYYFYLSIKKEKLLLKFLIMFIIFSIPFYFFTYYLINKIYLFPVLVLVLNFILVFVLIINASKLCCFKFNIFKFIFIFVYNPMISILILLSINYLNFLSNFFLINLYSTIVFLLIYLILSQISTKIIKKFNIKLY